MDRIVLLDSTPLGLAVTPAGRHEAADACHAWLTGLERAGVLVVVPAVIDYELRRELVRMKATAQLRNLNLLRARLLYLPVSEAAWDRAAEFWALARLAGKPTADAHSLDCDAVLAGQAATIGRPGDLVTVATSNLKHMSVFPNVKAEVWASIRP